MTTRECAIVMAYTGIVMLEGDKLDIFYRYIEGLIGRPVNTYELASKEMWKELKKRSEADFLKLCDTAVEEEKNG